MLEDSMATVIEIEPTMEALKEAVGREIPLHQGDFLGIRHYTFDKRIGWDTYLVDVNGCACAFTDGPLKETAYFQSIFNRELDRAQEAE